MTKGRILIAGGAGFIGRALSRSCVQRGYEVVVLTRSPDDGAKVPGVTHVAWDGKTLREWTRCVDGSVAVVNLAGKNVNCRYTPKNLDEIDRSRVEAVTVMGEAIRRCAEPPRVLVQASTTAIYGDAGDTWCDETRPAGAGIPPTTASKWEQAFEAQPTPLTRRVLLRISFVLGPGGGVLQMLSNLTRCFLGGRVGSGRQYISWIHIDDLVRLILGAIEDDTIRGTYNIATPNAVTNDQFMRALRRVLRRPWSPPVPAWAVRLGCFILRTEPVLALTGRRASVKRLEEAGFPFAYPHLEDALKDALARS